MGDRTTYELDVECPSCGESDVLGHCGGDEPAMIRCQNCGHYTGSWEGGF